MDKRCKDCKYKVYEKNDVNEAWGFCSCMDKELREITNKHRKELNKYSAKYGLVKDSNNMPDNVFPSCQMVQSAYYEICDCYCNHYTVPIECVPIKWEESDKEE